MKALKDEVADLRKDVDYLKSTDFTSLFEAAETQGVPGISEMPPATTRDMPKEDVAADASETETKTDEEKIVAHEEAIYDDLPDLEEIIVQLANHTSLTEKSMAGSSGASVAVTPGTDAQDQSVTPGIDSLTYGEIV